MGEMLLNGRLYGANGVMELTQAQYDALPQSKLTDGVLYCVKDAGFVEGEQFAPVIYSLEEREIGTWTDGKPLYQKTVHINALPSTSGTSVVYQHSIADIDEICNVFGRVRFSTGSNAPFSRVAMWHSYSGGTDVDARSLASDTNTWITLNAVSKTTIEITTGSDRSNCSADVTIQYTKTTDVAGSGTYGTDGARMVHYSNDEHIIGTWTDGKTLYEKTVHINALPSTAYTAVSYPHNIANIDQICGYEAIARWSNGQIVQIPRLALYNGTTWSATANYCFGVDGISKTDIIILVGADRSALNADVTIRYTKTV